jgi:class 3 adenylate cyclase/tetratricopeptide (TPR) repeat protein
VLACPSCGSPVADAARFCPTCGASVAGTCPSCGSPISSTARFCETCGHALAPATTGLEERKLVSILFADVTGSTALGERLDPERLRDVLATYFSAMSAVIESWGGTVEKYIGDAIMAVFGVPLVREDDAVRALNAALEMLRRVGDLNEGFLERHGVELRVRIGVNTGEVVAPRSGPNQQMLVIGDAVNVAARLEQSAEPGSVLAGPTTYLAARDAFEFGEERVLELKGKEERVGARAVMRPRGELVRGVPGLRTRMVGRTREFDTLVDLLHEAINAGDPRVALVVGPAGIGKSRLVLEFLRLAASQHDGVTVLRGRCPAAGPAVTFWALGEILREACGIALDEPAQAARERLGVVRDLLGRLELDAEDVDRTVYALAITAGISLEDNALDRYSPDAVDEELGRAWPRFASSLAERGPAVLVIEDLHWASERLLAMLERLASRSFGPLFVLATARPEFLAAHPGFGAGAEEFSSVTLRPLSDDQGAELLAGLLAEANLPTRLTEDILARAEGNPFFIEEILRRLIDEGVLVHADDRWEATEAAARVVLPETVQGLLAARIDTLPDEEKRVLQEAAVIGRVFWAEPVARALGNGTVQGHLTALEHRGLVFARPTSSLAGQVEYAFRHALVREVAYAGLPKSRRARAHADHAAWIERLAADRVDEFADLIAHHYGSAVSGEDSDLAWSGDEEEMRSLRERAYEAAMRAGTLARKRYALDRAAELHELAVEFAAGDDARARAFEELGADHDAAYHGDPAFEAYMRALDLVRAGAGDGADVARLCLRAGKLASKIGPFHSPPRADSTEALIREGLSTEPEPTTRAWLLELMGEVALMWSELGGEDPLPLSERIRAAEEALALAETIGDPDLLAWTVNGLAALYELARDIPRSYRTVERLAEFVDDIPSPIERAERIMMLALTLAVEGRYLESVEPARRAYDLARGASAHARMHGTYARMVGAFHLGRWDEVRELVDEHAELYPEETGVPCGAVNGGVMLGALALAEMGIHERARELLAMIPRDVQAHAGLFALAELALGDIDAARRRVDPRDSVRGWWRYEVELAGLDALVALEDWDGVRQAVPSARAFVDGSPLLGQACDRAEGVLELATGDRDRGIALLRSAIAGFERMSVPFEVAKTKELLAEVEKEGAEELLAQALETYDALGARPHAERARAALAGTD